MRSVVLDLVGVSIDGTGWVGLRVGEGGVVGEYIFFYDVFIGV